jgi:hypothetical protein
VASKTVVELFDDLDGGRADETVGFALDGVEYEIDLSTENATALRDGMAEFIRHAHRVTSRTRRASTSATEAARVIAGRDAEKPARPKAARSGAAGKPNRSASVNVTAEIRRLASETASKAARMVEQTDAVDTEAEAEPDTLFAVEPTTAPTNGNGNTPAADHETPTTVGPVPALVIPFQEAGL